MLIYPTLELQNGRCVTLDRGRLEHPTIWHVDPVETARGFAAAGASWMQVTDFDGVEGQDTNADLLEEIIRAAGIPVQLGGGFRTRDSVERWLDKGAGRIIIGTQAARDPSMVVELAKYHPDQIVLAVDVWQGQVMTEGWRTPSAITPEDFIAAFNDSPLAAVLVTDIDSDIEDTEAGMGVISGLAGVARAPVIARGTVRNVDDISRLKYIPNISGTVVSRALFQKTLDLSEALAVAQPTPEPVADFR